MNEAKIVIEAWVVPVGSKNLSRLSHTLGGSRTSRARILFDDPSRSAGSENEAQRKGYAVKFAKVERRTQGKGADYFQKWRTITQTGVLPRRRGCGLFPKLTDFFFLAPNPVRRSYFGRPTILPRLGLYNTMYQEGWGDSRPFGPAHCIGAPLPNGLLSPPAALRSEASKRSCRELSP